MKPIIFAAIILLGVIAAAGAVLVFVGSEPTGPTDAPATTLSKPAPRDAAAAPAPETGDLARLKQENALLKEQLDNMRAELAKAQQAEAALAHAKAAEGSTEALDAKEFWGEANEAAKEGKDKDGKEKKRERRDRGNFEERAQQFQAMMDQFYDDALAQSANNPEVQDRIATLRDYSSQMMELRQQMRGTDDPAAQENLRAQVEGLRDEMKPLVKDQQDYMLRQAAQNSGVKDEKTQQRVADAVRDTMKSPFFMQGGGRGGNFGPQGGGGSGGNPGGGRGGNR